MDILFKSHLLRISFVTLAFLYMCRLLSEMVMFLYCWAELPVNYVYLMVNALLIAACTFLFYWMLVKSKVGITQSWVFPSIVIVGLPYFYYFESKVKVYLFKNRIEYMSTFDLHWETSIVRYFLPALLLIVAFYSLLKVSYRANNDTEILD